MRDPVRACEQIAQTIGQDGADSLAASSGNSDVVNGPQPAETAPRDGTEFLAKFYGVDGLRWCRWDIEHCDGWHTAYFNGYGYEDSFWYVDELEGWMPIPAH